jgi:hypothetical protein
MPDVYATIAEAEVEVGDEASTPSNTATRPPGRSTRCAAAALEEEGRKRMADGTFFGHIAYVSAHARRR